MSHPPSSPPAYARTARSSANRVPAAVRFTVADPRIEPCPESGCWLWVGEIVPKGYGMASVKEDGVWRGRRAHLPPSRQRRSSAGSLRHAVPSPSQRSLTTMICRRD